MKTAPAFADEHVHFIGIGGIGMSALAQLLHRRGAIVTGSDAGDGERLPGLAAAGMTVHSGHSEDHLSDEAACIIATAAVREGNPEIEEAHKRGLQVLTYAEALGRVAAEAETTAVAGTHGKTTTAAMLAWILVQAHKDPSAVIGGIVPQLGGNALFGDGGAMVVEACEFRRSFLELNPAHAIITNVSDDHMDYYQSTDQLRSAFREFAGQTSQRGVVITPALVARDLDLRGTVTGRLVTIGAKNRDVQILEGSGGFRIRIPESGDSPLIRMQMPGAHNRINATSAAAAAHIAYGVPLAQIAESLATFAGIERRFRILRSDSDAVVIDDYAHHPDEIEATLLTVRQQFPDRRIVAAFQPHLADRVRRHFSGFLNALAYADELFLVRDYRVLGRDDCGRDGAQLLRDAMNALRMDHIFCPDLGVLTQQIRGHHKSGDVICVMGAGDIGEVSLELADRI